MNQERHWIILSSDSPEMVEHLSKELNLPKIIISLLFQRGYKTKEAIENFLNPSLKNLHNPFTLPDLEKAVERVTRAVRKNERILVYGDYDVDGITGTALLVRTLKGLGADVGFYIPIREREGYGLSVQGLSYAREQNISLIITVDCGTTNFKEIDWAKESGIDIIVCDHHEPKEELPSAYALINPKRQDSQYPFSELAGVGVAFKFAWALLKESQKDNAKEELIENLDLVALGTVADIAPLIDENRILVKFGLKSLPRTAKIGLQELLKITGLKGEITPYHIGFILGPRINASGRISEARKGAQLLLTEDKEEAQALAQELDILNQTRQAIEEEHLKEATLAAERIDLSKNKILVLANKNWHEGVIGIVASKIVEQFYRPTILIAVKENLGKGSGRSIPGFHLYNALKTCASQLLRFGGHKYAAGLEISPENIERFNESINSYAEANTTSDIFESKLFIDTTASLYEINKNLLSDLEKFEPFGTENPLPTFATFGLEVVGLPRVVGKEHLRFKVREKKELVMEAIAFGRHEDILKLVPGKENHIDIAYEFNEHTFAGKTKIQLKVRDLKIRQKSHFYHEDTQ